MPAKSTEKIAAKTSDLDLMMSQFNGKVIVQNSNGVGTQSSAGYYLEVFMKGASVEFTKGVPVIGNSIILGDGGEFSFNIVSAGLSTAQVSFVVKSPNGLPTTIVSGNSTVANAFKSGGVHELKVNPYSPMSLGSAASVSSNKITVKGKAIYDNGEVVKEKRILLYGKDATSASADHIVIETFKTQSNGEFKLVVPKTKFSEVYAYLGDKDNDVTCVIPMDNDGNFTAKLILVFQNKFTDDEDCSCTIKTPRLPDSEDLVSPENKYSQDIGGSCVNFTTPNRSLEEFTFSSIVRTTDPRGEYTAMTKEAIAEEWDGNVANVVNYKKYLDKTLRQSLTKKNQLEWDHPDKKFSIYQALTIAHGHVLTFKQVFKSDGYSMGDLVYSLPLAPGQKKLIVTYDWNRVDEATKVDELSAEDRLTASISRDRDIDEIIAGSLSEDVKGGSKSKSSGWAVGGGVSAPTVGPVSVSVSGGYSAGKASSESWQQSSKDMTASMHNKLKDSTQQSSSMLRSQRNTVIATAKQGESYSVTSEVVANHNHCHAVTMQYFQVLRHIVVEQELSDVQECLFVPLTISPFDYKKVLRWRQCLQTHLRQNRFSKLGAELSKGFDAMERIDKNYVNYDVPPVVSESKIREIYGSFKLRLNLNRPQDKAMMDSQIGPAYNQAIQHDNIITQTVLTSLMNHQDINEANWTLYSTYFSTLSIESIRSKFSGKSQIERDEIFYQEIAPEIAENYVKKMMFVAMAQPINFVTIAIDGGWKKGEDMNIRIHTIVPKNGTAMSLKRSDIPSVGLITPLNENHLDSYVTSGFINYRTSHYNGVFTNQISGSTRSLDSENGALVYTPLKTEESFDFKKEDLRLASQLLEHVNNENVEYYHHVIWYHGITPDRRYMMLDRIQLDSPDFTQVYAERGVLGRSVASLVENKIIALVGNCLVFPVSAGYNLDPTYKLKGDDDSQDSMSFSSLLEHYQPISETDGNYKPSYRISIPTPGVFAEAVMGACNSCEKIDDSRFWQWEDSPIDEPTAINPIDTSSRYQSPLNTQGRDFSTPVINIQNSPAAPDPTGLSGVMELLGKSGTFKDITGTDATNANSIAALNAANQLAKANGDNANSLASQALTEGINSQNKMATMKNATKNMAKGEDYIDRNWPAKDFPDKNKALKEKLFNSVLGGDPNLPDKAATNSSNENPQSGNPRIPGVPDASSEENVPDLASILSGMKDEMDDFRSKYVHDMDAYIASIDTSGSPGGGVSQNPVV